MTSIAVAKVGTPVETPAWPEALPTEAPPEKELTPQERLQDLEKEALEKGMSAEQFRLIQTIGPCDQQIQQRIVVLNEWLVCH